MCILIKILFSYHFIALSLFGQKIPSSFKLNQIVLNKIFSDPTPSGNSVEYIEFMGNDVWIATSVGFK